MKKRVVYIASLVILVITLLIVSFVKTSQPHVLSRGVDSYNTHRLLFGDTVFSQELTNDLPVTAIGLLVVNIRRTEDVPSVLIRIDDMDGNELAQTSISPSSIRDDKFAYAVLDEPLDIPSEGVIVHAQAPDASNENALGWRFDPASTNLARYEKGVLQKGMFAIAVREQVPIPQAASTFLKEEEKNVKTVLFMVGVPLLFAALATRLGWNTKKLESKRYIEWGIVVIVIVAALATRMYAQSYMGGVSGGDPYNYLLIAKSLTEGENPFEGAKRLPGYPLLLTPTVIWPSIDAHVYMRTLSAIAAMGTLALTFRLTRILKFTWPAQLFAVAALAWQPNFFATSLRPEPYSLFGFLLMASLVLFFSSRSKWQLALFGCVVGYAAMVRQEGFVLAAILGVAAVIRELYISHRGNTSFAYKKLLWMFLPALVFVLPFFISNTVQFGNPLYTPYFEGEKLEIVDSPQAFHDASISTWAIITSMWKPSWVQDELLMPYDDRVIPIMFLATIAWWVAFIHRKTLIRSRWVQFGLPVVGAITIGWATYLSVTDAKDAAKFAPLMIAGIIIAAPSLFLAKNGWRGILITIVLASQLLIATWFHPYAKHYQQSYPIIMMMIAAAIMHLTFPKKRIVLQTLTASIWTIPFVMSLFILYSHLGIFVDAHNASAALDSVTYRATRTALELPAPYGYTIEGLPAWVYHSKKDIRSIDRVDQETDAQTLIVSGKDIEAQGPDQDTWEFVTDFLAEGKDEVLYRSSVYTRK